MPDFHGKHQFFAELNQANLARLNLNEGKARVCARRAVGILAGEYLERQGYNVTGLSAYERLKSLESLADLPSQVQTVIGHFLLRTNPNGELPEDVDLIAEAQWLENQLLVRDRDNP